METATTKHRALPLIRRRIEWTMYNQKHNRHGTTMAGAKVAAIVSVPPGIALLNHRVSFMGSTTVQAAVAGLCRKVADDVPVDPADVRLEAIRFAADGSSQCSSLEETATLAEVRDAYRHADDYTLYLQLVWAVDNDPFEWELISDPGDIDI